MGVEEWEAKYKIWGKCSLEDFLDKEDGYCDEEGRQNNKILHMGSSGHDCTVSQLPLKTKGKSSLNAAYPEGYDTIDRRRKKKIRDPGGLVNAQTKHTEDDYFPPDLALLRQKRGELVLRQVAEMEEEDEKMTPCLRPYKNGLLYKTRMWAKNKLENTLENYVAYQEEEAERLRARVGLDSEGSDEMQNSLGSEEELEEIASLAEAFHSEDSWGYDRSRYALPYVGYNEKLQGYRDKKSSKGKIGGWAPETMLSPVEEPSDEYVDPMDELQCLVETVSEYLAEKEEEISKYGSLPKSNKSRLSSQGSARTESTGDEQGVTPKETKDETSVEAKENSLSEQGMSGVKNAMNSLFSSFTDKVTPSSKQTRSNSVEHSETPSNVTSSSGLSKLFSFMPVSKSPSPTPVAVVSPTQEADRKFPMSFRPSDAKSQEINPHAQAKSHTQIQNNGEIMAQKLAESQPSFKVNPLKMFSQESAGKDTSKRFSEDGCFDLNKQEGSHKLPLDHPKAVGAHLREGKPGRGYGSDPGESTNGFMEQHSKNEHMETTSHKSMDSGFFSPFKKSFSSLISPVPPMPPQHQTQTVFPIFRSAEDVSKENPVDNSLLGGKIKLSFLSSDNMSAQQPPKADGGILSGLLKFASVDESSVPKNTPQNPTKPDQACSANRSSAHTASSSNLDNAKPLPQNVASLHETQPKVNTEPGWFSNLFKAASNENVQPAAPQGQRPVNQSSQPPLGSNQKVTRGEQQNLGRTVNQQMQNWQQAPGPSKACTVENQPSEPESQGLFSSLFKYTSSEETSDAKAGPQQGLLSGIIKMASSSDVSTGTQPSQTQPKNNPSQPIHSQQTYQQHQPHPQQSASNQAQTGGLLSGLLRFSSAENVSSAPAANAPHQQRVPPHSQLSQRPAAPQQASPQQGPPQQGGILSGLFKFASSESISSSPSNTPQQQQSSATGHSPHQVPSQNLQQQNNTQKLKMLSSHSGAQQTNTGQGSSQNAPQQATSQQGGLLSGIFKFASADNVSSSQTASTQQADVPTYQTNEHHPKPQRDLRQTSFLESKTTITEQRPPVTQQDTQSGILSGLFSKLRTSSEEGSENNHTPIDQKQQQQSVQKEVSSQNIPSRRQLPQPPPSQAVIRDQKLTEQRGFISGLFSRTSGEVPSTKPGEQPVQCTDHRASSTNSSSLTSGLFKKNANETTSGGSTENGKESKPSGAFDHLVPRHKGVAINLPAYGDDSLDLRTSASYSRSQRSHTAYASNSAGHLPQIYYSSHPSNPRSMSNSTENLYSSSFRFTGQGVMSQPYLRQSYPSLQSVAGQYGYENDPLLYTTQELSPNYEHSWIQESVIWQQLNDQSLGYFPEDYGHLPCGEPQENFSQPLSNINVVEHQEYCVTQPPAASYMNQGHIYNPQEYPRDVVSNSDVQKMWSSHNSLDRVSNQGYSLEEGGALNLSKKGNGKFGRWHSFNEESCYSLNSVAYHEGYYEENPPNLSYSANGEYKYNATSDAYRQPVTNESYPDLTACPNGWNYYSNIDTEDHAYLEESEWYQQWLSLLEQGMWWPADDRDCGYFVYTDYEYIYALLTDGSGQYVYACAPEEELWLNGQMSDHYPSAWLHNEMVMVCGFKIPLCNEDELLWLPGQNRSEAQLLSAPLDLSAAYRKGNEIMNLNLERFSQMFERSILAQKQQAMDFSSYRLNKVKVDTRQRQHNNVHYQDPLLEAVDLTVNGINRNHSNLNRKGMKELLSQKVSVSSTQTTGSSAAGVYSCYQPRQRRRSSTGVQIRHIDDTTEEEWRKRVEPGEEQPNRSITKISSFLSSIVGKSPESHKNMTVSGTSIVSRHSTCPAVTQGKTTKSPVSEVQNGQPTKGILSTGLESLKSKIIKEDASPAVTPSQSTNQQTSKTHRILPKTPTGLSASSVSAQSATQKPKLARQATMSQQSSVPFTSSSADVSTNSTSETLKHTLSQIEQSDEKPSEQPQGGFLSFFKTAVGMEEPKQEPVKSFQTTSKPPQKNEPVPSGVKGSNTQKESTGVSSLFGSIGDFFSVESPSPQQPLHSQKSTSHHQPSAIDSKNDAKNDLSRAHQITKSEQSSGVPNASQAPQGHVASKSASQIFSPTASEGSILGRSQTMPPAGQTKPESADKPATGLFGFSIGDIISGPTGTKEETPGKGLLSMFSSSAAPPQAASAPQVQDGSAKETSGKNIMSFFAGSSTQQSTQPTTPLNQTTRTAPPKETTGMGLLSMFSGPSTQQTSTPQTGSSHSGPTPPKETPGAGLLSMFGTSSPQQTSAQTSQPPPSGTAPRQDPPGKGLLSMFSSTEPTSQQTGSIFGGILGGSSTTNESPAKGLFSMFGGSNSQPPANAPPKTGPAPGILSMFGGPSPQMTSSQPDSSGASNLQEQATQKEPPTKGLLSLFSGLSSQPTEPQSTSILGGILSGSNASEGPAKGLLSMFGGQSPEPNAQTSPRPKEQIDTPQKTQASESIAPQNVPSKEPLVPVISIQQQSLQQEDTVNSTLPESGVLSNKDSASGQQQIPSQSSSVISGTLSGTSETPGKGLPSVSGPSPQPTQTSTAVSLAAESTSGGSAASITFKDDVPPKEGATPNLPPNSQGAAPQIGTLLSGILSGASGPKDSPGKTLFSVFSGPSEPSSSETGASSSKELPGKSLFSMFGGPSPQQPSTTQTTSLLGGILPGGTAGKDVPGKGLLSMFGGPSSTPSATGPTSKPSETEGLFNVSSLFSRGPATEDNRSKTGGFGFLNMSFLDEKKPEAPKPQNVSLIHPAGEADIKVAASTDIVPVSITQKTQETVALQAQVDASKQVQTTPPPQCPDPTGSEKVTGSENIDEKCTALDINKSPTSREVVADTQSHTEQCTEQGQLQDRKSMDIQSQAKQDDVTLTQSITREGEEKPAEAEKSVLGSSAEVVSGFMSKMFSTAAAPSKPSGDLFSQTQSLFFKSQPTPGSQTQQKTSLFGLPSSLPTESLKSDLFGMFKTPEASNQAETMPAPTSISQSAVQDEKMAKDVVLSAGNAESPKNNQTKTESELLTLEKSPQDSIKSSASAVVNPSDVGLSAEIVINEKVIEGDLRHEKPIAIVGEPEGEIADKSGPPTESSPKLAQQPQTSEPSQSMFGMAGLSAPTFGFMAGSGDAGKSFGSLFSSAPSIPKGLPSMPQSEAGGLLSGFKSFSTGLFQEEKSAASKNEPAASLFGAKLNFPWQKETTAPPKQQTPIVVTTQPKAQDNHVNSLESASGNIIEPSHLVSKAEILNKDDSEKQPESTSGSEKNSETDVQKNQNTGPVDALAEPHVSVSTPEVDPPLPKEQENQVQPPPSTDLSSGLQQENKELLSAKRLVAS